MVWRRAARTSNTLVSKSWKYPAAESIKKAVGKEALAAHLKRHQGHILGGGLAWKDLELQAGELTSVLLLLCPE